MSRDEGESKQELRRRMEETRDSISETVAEIKTVVAEQYEEVRERVETVREGVSEVLDWREQFERNPVVWGAGAVSVGILIGIGLSRAFDDEPPARGRRRRPTEPNAGQRLMGELTGLADAMLPTISGHLKEMFGLDLDAYLRETRRRQLAAKAPPRSARKGAPRKGAAQKGAAKKATAKKGAAKRGRAKAS